MKFDFFKMFTKLTVFTILIGCAACTRPYPTPKPRQYYANKVKPSTCMKDTDCAAGSDCGPLHYAKCGQGYTCACVKKTSSCDGVAYAAGEVFKPVLDIADPTCRKFVICVAGEERMRDSCQTGQVWNWRKGGCTDQSMAECPLSKADPCASKTCLNQGKCTVTEEGSALCLCAKGYAGDMCQTAKNIRCDDMYDCVRRCRWSNAVCEADNATTTLGYCNCQGDGIDYGALYGDRSHLVGGPCKWDRECHGGCQLPLKGYCKVTDWTCQCFNPGDHECANNRDCRRLCDTGVGECMADDHCECDANEKQMMFRRINELFQVSKKLSMKVNGGSVMALPGPAPAAPRAAGECARWSDCRCDAGLPTCQAGSCACV